MAPSERSSQSGRGRPLVVELGCLDGARFEGAFTQSAVARSPLAWSTRRHLGEQLATSRLGEACTTRLPLGQTLRRGALSFGSRFVYGRKQHLVTQALEPGADRSSSSGALVGSATLHEPTKPASWEPKDLRMT